MARRPSKSWSHPLTVAVVAAFIGVVGSVAAALVGSGGSSASGGAAAHGPEVAITSITTSPLRHERTEWYVTGTEERLSRWDRIYAVASPPARHRAAARRAAAPPRRLREWFTSAPASADASGHWSTTIETPSKDAPLTVFAVQVTGTPPTSGGGCGGLDCATPPQPGSPGYIDRGALELQGPATPGVAVRSKPFIARLKR